MLLNYFLNYKYNNNDVENTYYYLKTLKQLSHLPIFYLKENSLENIASKEIIVKTVDAFGKPINQNLTINYQVLNSMKALATGRLVMKDTDTLAINLTDQFPSPGRYFVRLEAGEDKMVEIKTIMKVSRPVTKVIKTTNSTTNETTENKTIEYVEKDEEVLSNQMRFVITNSNTLRFLVRSKIKINYLKCSITGGAKEGLKEL